MEINRSEEMLKYVEGYYRESKYYLAQNNAKGEELNIIHEILEDLPNQFNPQTATWGLRLWDELLEIDGGIQSVEDHRAKVMMKLIALPRITPISLERLIKSIAKANVDIIRNVAPYTFQIRVREDSLDCNSNLIRQIVEDYKEAHMAFHQAYYLGRFVLKERIYLKTLHRMTMYWFLEEWLLNGAHSLNGEMKLGFIYPMYNLLVRNRISVVIPERFYTRTMRNTFIVKTTEKAKGRGSIRPVFKWWNGDLNSMPEYKTRTINRIGVINPERVSSPVVTISHNLWHLEGSVMLDGSQTLDAYQIKEVL